MVFNLLRDIIWLIWISLAQQQVVCLHSDCQTVWIILVSCNLSQPIRFRLKDAQKLRSVEFLEESNCDNDIGVIDEKILVKSNRFFWNLKRHKDYNIILKRVVQIQSRRINKDFSVPRKFRIKSPRVLIIILNWTRSFGSILDLQ